MPGTQPRSDRGSCCWAHGARVFGGGRCTGCEKWHVTGSGAASGGAFRNHHAPVGHCPSGALPQCKTLCRRVCVRPAGGLLRVGCSRVPPTSRARTHPGQCSRVPPPAGRAPTLVNAALDQLLSACLGLGADHGAHIRVRLEAAVDLQRLGRLQQGPPPLVHAAHKHGGADGHAALARSAKGSACAGAGGPGGRVAQVQWAGGRGKVTSC